MRTISETFDLSTPTQQDPGRYLIDTTCLGIEHELEDMPPSKLRSLDGWRMESDGSLRNNGIEYVFDGPAGGCTAEARIESFAAYCAEVNPDINERTATHVHIDFRNMTMQDVGRFVAIYSILEDTLFQLCDKSRLDNPFCVPFTSSNVMMSAMRDILAGRSTGHNVLSESFRYGALNLAALPRYGTVELRMRETIVEAPELYFWCNIFLSIKQFIRTWEELAPSNVVQTMSAVGVDTIMRTILTSDVWDEIVKRVPDAEYRVFSSAQEMQSHFSEWSDSVLRTPYYIEDNILVRRALKTGRIREMIHYARVNRLVEMEQDLISSVGYVIPTQEDWDAWWDGDTPLFTVSEEGAELYNSSVRTRNPLQAGQVLTRQQLTTKANVLRRPSIVNRVQRVILPNELLDARSAGLLAELANPN